MKKKMFYTAPVTEQMEVRMEMNIMSNQNSSSPANMTTHSASEWGDWE